MHLHVVSRLRGINLTAFIDDLFVVGRRESKAVIR